MPPVPVLRPDEAIHAFERLGWHVARQSGSHIVLVQPGRNTTLSVPRHAELARGTLRSLIRAADLTVDEFVAAL